MAKLYNVSIINKHDIWLKKDEENPLNWVVMSKEHLSNAFKGKLEGKKKIKEERLLGMMTSYGANLCSFLEVKRDEI